MGRAHPVEEHPAGSNRWLHRFAALTAGATLVLIFVGGLVTSTGSGLAVPDWPLSFGQLFPPLVGGVLYEHGHRMVAASVGLLTAVLALWLWLAEPRAWVRALGVAALLAILLQGILGGVTVLLELPTAVSVAHGLLAQAFFGLVVVLALVTGPGWGALRREPARRAHPSLPWLCVGMTALLYGQLFLGALMRHTGAGLAIPDFPLAFGRLVPPISSQAVLVHFLHRLGAVAVAGCAFWVLWRVGGGEGADPRLVRPALLLVGLLAVQVALGALIIWTQKAVVPTTAHVAGGGGMWATSLVLTLRAWRLRMEPAPARPPGCPSAPGRGDRAQPFGPPVDEGGSEEGVFGSGPLTAGADSLSQQVPA